MLGQHGNVLGAGHSARPLEHGAEAVVGARDTRHADVGKHCHNLVHIRRRLGRDALGVGRVEGDHVDDRRGLSKYGTEVARVDQLCCNRVCTRLCDRI